MPGRRDLPRAARRIALLGALFALAPVSSADAGVDLAPASARAILSTAFANRYEVDTISTIELVMRSRSGHAQNRRFHVVSKMIDDRLHGLGRLVEPPYLRGMTILVVERESGGHDSFVYLPSSRRVRRISTAQRGDAFLGSDLTYEDLERQHVDDYDLELRPPQHLGVEEVNVVRGYPRHRISYRYVDFLIARTDAAILETRYFKGGAEEPYRTVVAPRAGMVERSGHVLPTHLTVENRQRGTLTDVYFRDLVVNPPIESTLFTVKTLEQQRALPDGEGNAVSGGLFDPDRAP